MHILSKIEYCTYAFYHATPLEFRIFRAFSYDYLRKIIHVPFCLPKVEPANKKRMLDELMQRNSASNSGVNELLNGGC